MKAVVKDIVNTKNDSYYFDFKLNNAIAELVDAKCTIRKTPNSPYIAIQLSLENGIIYMGDSTYRVNFQAGMLNDNVNGYYYDLQLIIGSTKLTPIKGKIIVEWDVTE